MFIDLKTHLLATKDGTPIECDLTPGSYRDVRVLKTFQCDLPKGVIVFDTEKAYHDDELEDALMRSGLHIQLCPIIRRIRKRLDSSMSCISGDATIAE